MGICAKCIHFRGIKPPSQLFAQAIGTGDAAIASALAKMQEREQQARDAESLARRQQASTEGARWDAKPVMSGFCGLHEAEDLYLIAEVKNAGSRCEDFLQGAPDIRTCSTCAHRIAPQGKVKDQREEEAYLRTLAESTSAEVSISRLDNQLNKHREDSAARKSFEISGAYAAQGILAAEPQYLDYCSEFSSGGQYVVCLLKNSHRTCHQWSAERRTAPAIAALVATPQELGVANPDAPQRVLQQITNSELASHTRAVTPGQRRLSANGEGTGQKRTTATDHAAGRPVQPQVRQANEVLTEGPTPLTQGMVDKWCEFWEFILDVKLLEEGRSLVRSDLMAGWVDEEDRVEIAKTQQVFSERLRELNVVSQAERDFFREQNQPTFVALLSEDQKSGDPDSAVAFLLKLYDSANAPQRTTVTAQPAGRTVQPPVPQADEVLVEGRPPLTMGAAICCLQLIRFINALITRRGSVEELATEVENAWVKALVPMYRDLAESERQWVARTPNSLPALLDELPNASESRKIEIMRPWIQIFNIIYGDEFNHQKIESGGDANKVRWPSGMVRLVSTALDIIINTHVKSPKEVLLDQTWERIRKVQEMMVKDPTPDLQEELRGLEMTKDRLDDSLRRESDLMDSIVRNIG